jgi:transcriptional regulator of aromatic amino acid metabolism
MLYIETADRPGLLLEIIKIIADTNIDVESAEIDTEVCYVPLPLLFLVSKTSKTYQMISGTVYRVWLRRTSSM